jgi:hypothetical protein
MYTGKHEDVKEKRATRRSGVNRNKATPQCPGRLNDTKKIFKPAVAMCLVTNGQLLTNTDQVLSRWKEYLKKHLNESCEEKPHTNEELPRENDVNID